MSKILSLLFALAVTVGASAGAFGGSMTLLGVGKVVGAVAPATLAFGQQANQSTPTGPTVNFGTLAWGSGCTRVVVAVSSTGTSSGQVPTSVASIGGVAFTSVVSFADSGGMSVAIFESSAAVSAISMTHPPAYQPSGPISATLQRFQLRLTNRGVGERILLSQTSGLLQLPSMKTIWRIA
jgi:hypothetical protein